MNDSSGEGGPAQKQFSPRGLLVWGLAVVQMVGWGATYFAFPAFVKPMQAEFGWSTTAIAGALTSGLLVADLVSIPAGQWLDRHGGRGIVTAGSILAALALAAWSRISSLAELYVVMALIGVAQGLALNNTSFAIITANVRNFRLGLNYLSLVSGLAVTSALPVAGFLIVQTDWRTALLGLAAMQFFGCAVVSFFVLRGTIGSRTHEFQSGVTPSGPSPLRATLRRPAFWIFAASFSVHWFCTSSMSIHGLPMLQEWNVPYDMAILMIASNGPMQIVGRFLLLMGPEASARATGVLLWSLLSLAFFILALFGRDGVPYLIAFTMVFGVASGPLVIVRLSALAEIFGTRGYGAISGALSTAAIPARTGAPLAVAWMRDQFGSYVPVAYILFGLTIVATIAFAVATSARQVESSGPQ